MEMQHFPLSTFGNRERHLAGELLIAWASQSWASKDDHVEDGATLEFDAHSGRVYLVDSRHNVVVLNDAGELENWLNCGDCGVEGLRSEVSFAREGLCSHCFAKETSGWRATGDQYEQHEILLQYGLV